MSDESSGLFRLYTNNELDDMLDLTIVMSRQELDTILAIDAAHAERDRLVHVRPTVTMTAVKVA